LNTNQTQIVIIGAGYAGLIAARRLAWKTRRSDVAITLVNGTERFIERVNLHKFATNQPIGQPTILENLRKTEVNFVQGWVKAIHPAEHSLSVQTGEGTRQIKNLMDVHTEIEMVNGKPALVARAGDDPLAVISAGIRHGKIHELWIVGNPDKLTHI
jgi:NADPH-dependent 2,4-dienoyl-CoA reductase/sulfur reductase-like enzyme